MELWEMSPGELRGYALGLETAAAGGMVRDMLRREAAIARGFAARLDGMAAATVTVGVPRPAKPPRPSAPQPPKPPKPPEPEPVAAEPPPPKRGGAWTEERRQRQREHMQRLQAEGRVRRGFAPAVPPMPPEPEAAPEPQISTVEMATAEAIEEWLIAALVAEGRSQPDVEERILRLTQQQLINTANAQRRKRGEPEFALISEAA